VKQLAITDIRASNLKVTVDELKRRHGDDIEVKAIEMDVANEADVDRSVDETIQAFGRIDFAVNNAGIGGAAKPTTDVTLAEWQKVFDINVNASITCLVLRTHVS